MKRREQFQKFFISRFLLILVCVVVAEYAVKFLLDYSMLPVLNHWFFKDLNVSGSLSIVEILLFGIFLLIELLIGALKMMLPEWAEEWLEQALQGVENFAAGALPDIVGEYSIETLSSGKAGALVLVIFVALVLFLMPLIIAVKTFADMVADEVRYIEHEIENFYIETQKQKNVLLSDIAHDLRTPITTISGYAKALNDGMVADEEKQKEYLQAIQSKSERMGDLINLLFDYVRLGTEGFRLKKESVDIAELLRENAARLYTDVEEKGMEFYADIPEEVHLIQADALQLSRVITNLINNAIRHNEPGTQIQLELRVEPDALEVIIADNGAQIPTEVAEHIFDPFVVGDKSRRTNGGSGLGLSIAKKIVDMHGWQMRLLQNQKGYHKAFVINIKKS